MTDYAAKVAAGIKFLDSKAAAGVISADWRDKVDLGSLRLESCDVCVLGQVFGHYDTGKAKLGIDNYDTRALGFNTDYSMEELTEAWKDALGENGVLVEKGDVYKDRYGYAVKVIATTLVPVDNETITTYIVQVGELKNGTQFNAYSNGKDLAVFRKKDFETGGTYTTKVEKFVPKKGMFVTGTSGKTYYMVSDDEIREVKDGAYAYWLADLSAAERNSLKELTLPSGKKFSESIVK